MLVLCQGRTARVHFGRVVYSSIGFASGTTSVSPVWCDHTASSWAALVQLGIAQELIQVLFTGFVAMIALAGGLAFGLGGRDYAARILDQLSRDFTNRR